MRSLNFIDEQNYRSRNPARVTVATFNGALEHSSRLQFEIAEVGLTVRDGCGGVEGHIGSGQTLIHAETITGIRRTPTGIAKAEPRSRAKRRSRYQARPAPFKFRKSAFTVQAAALSQVDDRSIGLHATDHGDKRCDQLATVGGLNL